MISLVERSILPASAERVWRFFEKIETNYPLWHREHLTWRWLHGEPFTPGAIWYADEWIGPLRISSRFFVTDAQPQRMFSYRIGFPHALARAGGSFRVRPTPDGRCELTEEAHFGYRQPVIASVTDWVLAGALPVEELRRHMREEHTNLRAMLSTP
jgi:hypothetical protein